jgi:hypothetical protein
MTAETDVVERELVADLESLGERFADEGFCTDLYRALARTSWSKDGLDGRVALSFRRAEETVNGIRQRRGEQPLTLAQTGGEGEAARTVEDELGSRGWKHRPFDTSSRHDEHSGEPTGPPRDTHEQPEWEREAHAEAEANRNAG